jgi:hypothetical protein
VKGGELVYFETLLHHKACHALNLASEAMIRENRQLVTNELVEFEK